MDIHSLHVRHTACHLVSLILSAKVHNVLLCEYLDIFSLQHPVLIFLKKPNNGSKIDRYKNLLRKFYFYII